MRNSFSSVARILFFACFIYVLAFPCNLFAKKINICGTVSRAEVSESGDTLSFVVKEGNKEEEFGIYIEDDAMKYSDLIWESFEKKNKIRILADDSRVINIKNKCPYESDADSE